MASLAIPAERCALECGPVLRHALGLPVVEVRKPATRASMPLVANRAADYLQAAWNIVVCRVAIRKATQSCMILPTHVTTGLLVSSSVIEDIHRAGPVASVLLLVILSPRHSGLYIRKLCTEVSSRWSLGTSPLRCSISKERVVSQLIYPR